MLRMTESLNKLDHYDIGLEKKFSRGTAESICQYLKKILNTHQGSVAINPKLGTPPFDLSQGLRDVSDQRVLLQFMKRQFKQAETRIEKVEIHLMASRQVTVVLAFQVHLTTIEGVNIRMNGRLQSDSTFELELA